MIGRKLNYNLNFTLIDRIIIKKNKFKLRK